MNDLLSDDVNLQAASACFLPAGDEANVNRDDFFVILTMQIVAEFPQLASQALSTKKEIYDEYDRKLAGAQLRFTIAAPLTALTVTAAVLLTSWIAFILAVIPVLVWQGFEQLQAGTRALGQAIATGAITPPVIERLKNLRTAAASGSQP